MRWLICRKGFSDLTNENLYLRSYRVSKQATAARGWREAHILQRNLTVLRNAVHTIQESLSQFVQLTSRIAIHSTSSKSDGSICKNSSMQNISIDVSHCEQYILFNSPDKERRKRRATLSWEWKVQNMLFILFVLYFTSCFRTTRTADTPPRFSLHKFLSAKGPRHERMDARFPRQREGPAEDWHRCHRAVPHPHEKSKSIHM